MTGTLAITEVLRTALTTVDMAFTKTTLEHIERELCRHLSHLGSQQITAAAPSYPKPVEAEPVAGPSGLVVSSKPVISVEEESSGPSQYVTAVSVSSLEVEELPPASLLHQPTDQQVLKTAIWRTSPAFIFTDKFL